MIFRMALVLLMLTTSITLSYSKSKIHYGYSSWYGDRFHGRKTASGEIYNMNKLTAAHRTLPFGTYIKVTNLQNNKSVVVKVNDRGPFKANRIIDVSRKAASKLGFINQGLARVRLEILGRKPKQKATSNNRYIPIPSATALIPKRAFIPKRHKANRLPDRLEEDSFKEDDLDPTRSRFRSKHRGNSKRHKTRRPKKTHFKKIPVPIPAIDIEGNGASNSFKVLVIKTHESIKKSKKKVYKIQIGAYNNLEYAVERQKRFKKKGISTLLCIFRGDGKVFRILIKKSYKSEGSAARMITKLINKGIKGFVLRF